MTTVSNLQEITDLARRGAIFYVSHSGGKDSQAMFIAIIALVNQGLINPNQVRVIHADLGAVEHTDVIPHILDTIGMDYSLTIAKAYHKDGRPADFFSLIRQRRASLDAKGQLDAPAFPSSAARFCTSDLKTGPIWREIRNFSSQWFTDDGSLVINCVGIRSQESKARAKKVAQRGTLNLNKKNTNSKREAYDWWPIAHWSIDDVWHQIVIDSDQMPHPAYKLQVENIGGDWIFITGGNERLSCAFCIFGSKNDLRNAATARPELLDALSQLEIEVRTTMFAGETLVERINH